MKIVERVQVGQRAGGADWNQSLAEVEKAIHAVVWPPGSSDFAIYPESGKKTGEGNGVKPIHYGFLTALGLDGWAPGGRRLFSLDAVKHWGMGYVGLEWETGNISSSHRALNRLHLAQRGDCIGGVLILPTRRLYRFLTDRIGNFSEIEPYLPLYDLRDVLIRVYAVEHDREDLNVPRIAKGTDGRALI